MTSGELKGKLHSKEIMVWRSMGRKERLVTAKRSD